MEKRLRSKKQKAVDADALMQDQESTFSARPEIKVVYEKEVIKKGKKHTQFGFWTKPVVMAFLKEAYLNGANDTEASAHAGLIYDSFRQKLQTKIVVEVCGERDEITLRQLFDHWSEQLIMNLKSHILKTSKGNALIYGTSDAWRWLERRRSKDFGLKAGQGSVDGNAPADINSLVALRAGAVLKKRKLSLK